MEKRRLVFLFSEDALKLAVHCIYLQTGSEKLKSRYIVIYLIDRLLASNYIELSVSAKYHIGIDII